VPRRLLVIIALAAVAACGGEPTITAKALGAIMPSAADAPPGTQLQAEQSGPKTLDEFVADTDVRSRLRRFGFKVGYVAVFTTANFPEDLSASPVGTKLYGAFAVVFRDAGAGRDALTFYRKRVPTKAKNATPVLTQGLGPDSFGFRFSSLEDTPLPGLVYFWRVGNALFEVVGVGNPDSDGNAFRALAKTINIRAMEAG
jgi:hypothetical protein